MVKFTGRAIANRLHPTLDRVFAQGLVVILYVSLNPFVENVLQEQMVSAHNTVLHVFSLENQNPKQGQQKREITRAM